MPAARGLAGDIAELVGRPTSEGWVLTRYLQDAGIFAKGRGGRGGAGSPRAESWHAVLLMLALASEATPSAAVGLVCELATLPFCRQEALYLTPGGGWEPKEVPGFELPHPTFVEYLSV